MSTWTLFVAPGGVVITAFHHETLDLRSRNLGTGDYILQPVADVVNNRRVQRVNAAVVGAHTRHGQLLPPEFYLYDGADLVTAIRSGPAPLLAEMCTQSVHAFITFAGLASEPRAIKAACNDFELEELAGVYLRGRLKEETLVRCCCLFVCLLCCPPSAWLSPPPRRVSDRAPRAGCSWRGSSPRRGPRKTPLTSGSSHPTCSRSRAPSGPSWCRR